MRMALGPHRTRLVSARRGRGKRITKPPRKPCRKPCPPPHPFQVPTLRGFSPICDRGLQPCVIVASPIYAPVRDIRGVAPPRARPASQPLFPRKCVPVGRLGFALFLNRLRRGARTLSLRPFANAPSLVRVCVCRTHARTQRIKQRRRIPHTEM